MAAGTVTGDLSIGTDTLRSIESVRGSVFADTYDRDRLRRWSALNVGNNGNFNEFEGMAGNDTSSATATRASSSPLHPAA